MKKATWLDRNIAAPGPRLILCLTPEAYKAACKDLRIDSSPPWIATPTADATAHVIESNYGLSVIICISEWEKKTGVEVCGMIVHEAVHVWQAHCELIGEREPAKEQEAYAIQIISQALMQSFADQTKGRA